MLPWGALLGTLGLNYWQHKHGKPTICSFGRRFISPRMFLVGLAIGLGWFVPHYLDGFKIDLEHLTD